jgi:hypothetical protein
MDKNMRINRVYLFIVIGIYIITLSTISKNLFTPYLSYDEAGQFFISKGLNHDSNPLEKEKNLTYVIKNNSFYNLDPGGFTILLHYWSKISNSHIWLRLLPFLFFIGLIMSFIYLSYQWLKNLNIAILMGFIPIFSPVVLSMGFEIRAYSMESIGTIISIVVLEKFKSQISYKNLFLWSCVLSFYMTSRYSEIIIVFVVSLYVLFLIFNTNLTLKKKLLSSLAFCIPLLFTLAYIYFFALIFQNRNLEAVDYLPYISSSKRILLAPNNLLFLCLIMLLIILFFLKNRFPIIKKYEMLLFVTIFVNILFIILSFLGKHPWDPYSNRCISLFLLVLLCFSALLGELIIPLFKSSDILKYYFMVSVIIFTLNSRKDSLLIRLNKSNTYYNFQRISLTDYNHIYVDCGEAPIIRYLFEYGNLKTKKGTSYPDHFTFEKYGRHGFYEGQKSVHDFYMGQYKMNDLLEYDLLITPGLSRYGNNDKWELINGTTNFYVKSRVK